MSRTEFATPTCLQLPQFFFFPNPEIGTQTLRHFADMPSDDASADAADIRVPTSHQHTGEHRLRSYVLPVLLPTFLTFMASGMLVPVLPLYAAAALKLPPHAVGNVVGTRGVGGIFFAVPAGFLASFASTPESSSSFIPRGDRTAMCMGVLATAVCYALTAAYARGVETLTISRFAAGGSYMIWQVGQQAYVKRTCPNEHRGTVLSTVGLVARSGQFVGPIVGGELLHTFGISDGTVAAFTLAAALTLPLTPLTLMFAHKRAECAQLPSTPYAATTTTTTTTTTATPKSAFLAKLATVARWPYDAARRVLDGVPKRRLAFSALACALVMTVRASREYVIPILAHQGFAKMPAREVGIVVAFSSLLDLICSPLSGRIMDAKRWSKAAAGATAITPRDRALGRARSGMASMMLFVVGLSVMSLPVPSSRRIAACVLLYAGGALAGIANGLSSGLVMTLGTDLAPADATRTGSFLGVWRLLSDLGVFIGPLLTGAVGTAVLAHDGSGGEEAAACASGYAGAAMAACACGAFMLLAGVPYGEVTTTTTTTTSELVPLVRANESGAAASS